MNWYKKYKTASPELAFENDYKLLQEHGTEEDKKFFEWQEKEEQKRLEKLQPRKTKPPTRPKGYRDIILNKKDLDGLISSIQSGIRPSRIRFFYYEKPFYLALNDEDFSSISGTHKSVSERSPEDLKPALVSRIRNLVINNIGIKKLNSILFPEEPLF